MSSKSCDMCQFGERSSTPRSDHARDTQFVGCSYPLPPYVNPGLRILNEQQFFYAQVCPCYVLHARLRITEENLKKIEAAKGYIY